MKIIAEQKDGFVIQATKDEIYNLIGFYSSYSSERPRLKENDEIEVSKMYKQLYEMKDNQARLKSARSVLLAIAGSLELVEPVINFNQETETKNG